MYYNLHCHRVIVVFIVLNSIGGKETSNKSSSPAYTDEELFGFLNEPIKEAKQKREREKIEKKVVKAPPSTIETNKDNLLSSTNAISSQSNLSSTPPKQISTPVENNETIEPSSEIKTEADVQKTEEEKDIAFPSEQETMNSTNSIIPTPISDLPLQQNERKDETANTTEDSLLKTQEFSTNEESLESKEYSTLLNQYSDLQLENKLYPVI